MLRFPVLAAVLAAWALAGLAPGAGAGVRRAESILPPGQSGFVSASGLPDGSGSPHLYDQRDPFLAFRMKPAMLDQPGTEESPRAGVRIVRDAFGVPAVTGDTEADMWFGAGYAIAQDRLFQLEVFRRVTSGRAAEMLGRGYLDLDKAVRRDFYTDAELDVQFARLGPAFQARILSYRDGINAWIAEARSDPGKLPGEFAAVGVAPADWQARDTLAIGVYLARTVPSDSGAELRNARAVRALGTRVFDRILPLRTPGAVSTIPPTQGGRFPSQPGRTPAHERRALRSSAAFVRDLPLPANNPYSNAIPSPPKVPAEKADESGQSSGARLTPAQATPALAPRGRAAPLPALAVAPDALGHGGSNMWAIRGARGTASLFNGPQLGFSAPSILVELELHAPGIDVRGFTAAGAPVIGLGHNRNVAWGITSGTSDDDDLYAEQLVGDEGYRFRGRVETMDCRDEAFSWRPPPSDLIPSTSAPQGSSRNRLWSGTVDPWMPDAGRGRSSSSATASPRVVAGAAERPYPGRKMLSDEPLPPELSSGSETVRYCRTVHGPVEAREGDVAYARRYAIWGRELETLEGLAAVNTARSIEDVDRAAGLLTWNENLMAVDDRGNIGYWHPGLQPLRPRLWDERLPYPGSGEAEWRGMLPLRLRPWVINPRQGYLVQWNNVPSADWTSGDAPARPVLAGPFHRAAILRNRVAAAARAGGGYERTLALDRLTATTAQGRGPATARLRRARRGAGGDARVVLDTLLRWGGDYDRVVNGAVDPGVPAWDAFLDQARRVATGGLDRAVEQLEDGRSSTHVFDVTSLEAFALRVLSPRGYRLAAARALGVLRERFGSADPARWREQRRLYRPQPLGAAVFEPFPFFDRGTAEHAAELGP